jgi:hypothetical protein
MRRLLRRFGPLWRVQQQRYPQATARIETVALAARGGLADEVRVLRDRLAVLERDHLLLAAHVATLTEHYGTATPLAPGADDAEAARQRARLAAIAFYEERIGRLEDHVTRRGHARSSSVRSSGRRIPGEQQETAS